MSQPDLVALRNVLVTLYPDEDSIRGVVADAGIRSARITFGGSADNVWRSVLAEAEKRHRINALLDVVEAEYGENLEFQQACAAYRKVAGKSSHSKLESSDIQSTQAWHQRWFAPVMGLLIMIGAASSAWYGGWFKSNSQFVSTPIVIPPTLNSPMPASKAAVIETLVPTMPSATLTPLPTATKSVVTSSGPCTAVVKSTTGSTTVSLRETATGKALNYTIPVNEAVLILSISGDRTAYKISYHDNGREILGWLPADNLHLADVCTK